MARIPAASPRPWIAALACAVAGCAGWAPHLGAPEPLLADARQLTFEGRRAGEGYFGPEDRRLVFQSEREPGNPFFQIYLLDLETGETRRVSPGIGKATCGWIHPSGDRVLFASTHLDPEAETKQRAERALREAGEARRYAWDYDEHYDLFAVDLASGAQTRLSDARGYDAEASYSPDGGRIVFTSNRHAYEAELSPEDRELFERDPASMAELYLMDADGSNVRRLTHAAGYDGGAFFSPDGRHIVWRRFSPAGDTAEIFTMDLAGGDAMQLTSLGALSWAPFFHPSGEYVIFSSNPEGFGNFELYLVGVDGGEPLRVSDRDGFDGLPAFSHAGTRLAWTSGRTPSGASQLFVASWDHDAARRALRGERVQLRASEPTAPLRIEASIRADDLRRRVEALASEDLDGRRTGTAGEREATAYVARAFAEAGLEPAGDAGTWFQRFDFTAGVSLDAGNELRVERAGAPSESYAVDRDWLPLAFSRSGEARGGVVFAGYGIVAPAGDGSPNYDAYAGLEVEGRWVLALRFFPEDVSGELRQHLSRHASLRYKAMEARDRGALGLVLVNGPRSRAREPLVALRLDSATGPASLLVLSASDAVAESLLAGSPRLLGELQAALDGGEPVAGFALPDVQLAARIELVQERRSGRNVLGRLGSGSEERAPVVIGAHVDHLGREEGGQSLAEEDERGQIHPGADDNASGVAAVIAIAADLAAAVREKREDPTRDVVFAAWSGEEMGLLGSEAFAATLPEPVPHGGSRAVAAYLNLDMVGRLRQRLLVYGVSSSPIWPGEIERLNVSAALPIAPQGDSYLPTDATSFHLQGIPALSIFTGSHAEYHTPRDRPGLLNYDGLARIARFVEALALSLAERPDVPEFVDSERPEHLGQRAALRAWLGTVPSYAESPGPGLALAGVTKGGPADRAGVLRGDRVLELAGQRIENIYDYTYAIEALAIGEPVPIAIERDGRRIELEITPESRQ